MGTIGYVDLDAMRERNKAVAEKRKQREKAAAEKRKQHEDAIAAKHRKALKIPPVKRKPRKRKRGRPATHGRSKDPIFTAWMMMHQRCNNPNNPNYYRYGGRGISVHPRWGSFECFLEDMGERPKGKTLERKDNDGDYSPANCVWASQKRQSNNTRANVNITIRGVTKNVTQWAEHYGVSRILIYSRIRRGWNPETAVVTPAGYKY